MTEFLRRPLLHLQALLALALLLGGGGLNYGWRHMAVELAALLVLALNPASVAEFLAYKSRGLVILVLVSVAWPLLQAIPLPPAIWQALPGRELVIEAYGAAGIPTQSWFSFSLDPMRSLTAFCATLVPLAIIVVGSSLDQRQRIALAWSLGGLAAGALVLGAAQLSSANTVGIMQDFQATGGVLYAQFSNRNSTGCFFVIVALVLAALPWPRTPGGAVAAAAAVSLALLAVGLTQSRSAIALALVVPLFVATRIIGEWRARRGKSAAQGTPVNARFVVVAAVIVLGFVIAGAASLATNGRLSEAAGRFSVIESDRLEMWDDSAYVAGRYWPMGAGTGSFDDVFQVDESLEYVSFAKAGRAHNDYLELAIELGVSGLLVLLAWWVWIGWAAICRACEPDRWLGFAGFAGFVVLAAQSAVDYPLRNLAMLALAGVLVVLLVPGAERRADRA